MSVLAALSALGFALICLFAGRLGIVSHVERTRWLSFAGGAATAYVFVHLLPEIGGHRDRIAEAGYAGDAGFLYPVLLAGTCVYYGLESYLARTRRLEGPSGFLVHMTGFAFYFALIGYFLQHRGDNGWLQEVFYFIVLGLHMLALDSMFRQEHQELYDRVGRWVMAGSVLGGAALGQVFEFPAIVSGTAFALLAGGMILNVLKRELPASREGRFVPFLVGAVLCTVLLMLA